MSVVGRQTARICTYRAVLRAGVWQVTRDYVFLSEHPTMQAAIASACAAARAHEARGGAARVMAPPKETVISHRAPIEA